MVVFDIIISSMDYIQENPTQSNKSNHADLYPELTVCPRAYFDGAAQNDIYGCGVYMFMEDNMQYQICWNGGRGSNIKAEALALASLL